MTLAAPAPRTVPATMTVNLLAVDDEPKNLLALRSVLAAPDWNLVTASSGMEALKYLLQDDFAVILLDVQMPGMDGFDTAALIRERERTRDTPIIFLTAASKSETFVARGYSVGAVDYILKPLDPEILRSKVAVFVELFRKREELRQQTAQLADAIALLKSVLQSSTEHAIMAVDLAGRLLAWNAGAQAIYGYAAEAVVGQKNVRLLHTAEDLAAGAVEALFEEALHSGKAEVILECVRAEGRRFPASIVVNQRRDAHGLVVGFVIVSRDMAEQLRAQEERARLVVEQAARAEAEQARDRLQQVIDATPEGILILESDGRVSLSNATAREILGRTPELQNFPNELGLDILDLDRVRVPPAEMPLARVTRRGESIRGEQFLLQDQQSQRCVPVLLNGAPLRDTQGNMCGGVLVFQDITMLKDLEREKDSFLAAASHDMKNPLAAIKARAQILQRRAARIESPERAALAEGLAGIDQTAGQLASMINELLDVTRLQMGRPLSLERHPVDLVELCRRVTRLLQPLSDRHQIRLTLDAPALVGSWDGARLERVLTNLVTNALKFSPDGGAVDLGLRAEEGGGCTWAVATVRDQGVGIPPSDLPRVFERFYRASNAEGRFEGTGVGLFGALQIVEQHGGTLTVASEEGQGSTFTIRLPIEGTSRAETEATPPT